MVVESTESTVPTSIESMQYELDELTHAVAGREYESYMLPVASMLRGTIHLHVNGSELTHANKLPARFDVVDTARAQYEVLAALDCGAVYSGEPFCCVCGDRGCAFVHWEAERRDGEVTIEMEDLLERPIGDHRYVVPLETLRSAVVDLLTIVIEFMEESGIRAIDWAERKRPPVAGREHYATRTELAEYVADLRGQ